ncbi:MAG: SLC13 family permease [Saprospiraceae bacterium]|nr:SLC13 family permease [Saprospiraceae bacterium]
MKNKIIRSAIGPILFLFLLMLGAPTNMPTAAFSVVAITLWVGWWWVSEALPIGITALLPLVLLPLLDVVDINALTNFYANPIIFLFIGGFIIALAMERWNLHRRIALNIIARVGTNQRQIVLGFIVATAFLSMWISNTATTLMMLPIALSIIGQVAHVQGAASKDFAKALVLAVAYSASIGGLATLVGTPTTLIMVEFAQAEFSYEVPFDRWFFFAFPLVVVLTLYLWWHLTRTVFKLTDVQVPGSKQMIQKELTSLGQISREEKIVLVVFTLVALAWISRQYLIKPFFPAVSDTTIALMGALSLFVIPSSNKPGEMVMTWEWARRLPWEVILLFGGAFAVAGSFQISGLTEWIGTQLTALKGMPLWLLILIIVTVVNYLTELTQNMATCTLMLPVLAGLAQAVDVHPLGLMISMTIASSCAFMLPVATAPNAIVFGSRELQMQDMVRAGFSLNLVSIVLITIYTYYVLPLIWNIDLRTFDLNF